ncbi:MAG: GTP cyclohydrolase I FolE [Elusimicrobia bacterium]|nr:GTP cyclohydrolase I FolE [Elusimicrobiota bacterium]
MKTKHITPQTETGAEQLDRLADYVRELLVAIGEDPKREGLLKTPQRVAKALRELTSGYHADVDEMINNALYSETYNEMVLVKDITFYSLCEHHLLPFFGKAHVAYIPDRKIIGLSKIPKLVEIFAKRLQVQERMTNQIAKTLHDKLAPLGVGVIIEARHLCMEMRGAESLLSPTVTSSMVGCFQNDARTRKEFLALVGRNGH